jgi:hypothetical protein
VSLLIALLLPALTGPVPVLPTVTTFVAYDGVAAAPGVVATAAFAAAAACTSATAAASPPLATRTTIKIGTSVGLWPTEVRQKPTEISFFVGL